MKHAKILITRLCNSFKDEDGAVTVDWVVVTAAIVGLAIVIATNVGGSAQDHSELIGDAMSSQGIQTY